MARGQRLATGELEQIMGKLAKLDLLESFDKKFVDLQRTLSEIKDEMATTKKDLNEVQQMAKETKEKVGGLDAEIRAVRRREEERGNVLLNLQMEKMAYFLRLRNFQELEQEDLRAVMVGVLGEYLERSPEQMGWDLDQVYRVNSLYAATHDVPREVHIKLVRRETRDEILKKQRGGALTYKGKEITILKQIPRQVRELRRKYHFLSSKLYLKGVGFRWLMPEGLMVFWEGSRKKISNVAEAKAYMDEHKTLLEPEDTGVEEGEVMEEQDAGAGAAVEDLGEGGKTKTRALRSRTKR